MEQPIVKKKKKIKVQDDSTPVVESKPKKRLKITPQNGDVFYGLDELQEDAVIKELKEIFKEWPQVANNIENVVYQIAKILIARRVPYKNSP